MNVTIIGGGNIGTLMAAEMANYGHSVTVYTSKPKAWSNLIQVFDANEGHILTGKLSVVTDSLENAVNNAEIILITFPAQVFQSIAEKLLPLVNSNQIIGVIPGSGGAEFAFSELIKKGCTLFGLQRVHSIARLKEYGKSVYMLGKKAELQIGVIPRRKTEAVADIVSKLFKMPCVCLANYLCVTLTPSNPILHTTRLFAMFEDYEEGTFYDRNFLFYEEWSNKSSEILFACDKELMELCRVIPLELEDDVKSLRIHYESSTPEALTEKIQSINAFKGLTSPMKCVGDGKWIPDFNSRYFTADFGFGLKIILDLCEEFNVNSPSIKKVWQWYINTTNANENYFKLNITKNDLIGLYSL